MIQVLSLLNNLKDLDLSYKMDLDFLDCFGQKKNLSYNRRNTVSLYFSAYALFVANSFMKHLLQHILA